MKSYLEISVLLKELAKVLSSIADLLATIDIVKPEKESVKTVSYEEVRGLLAEKSSQGYTKEVKALLDKFGASKLSMVKPDDYEALVEEAKVIGNG